MCVCTCAVRGQRLPVQTVSDVVGGDVGVQLGVVRHLGLVDVGAVAHGVDVGETADLQVIVDLQSAVFSQTAGCRNTDL